MDRAEKTEAVEALKGIFASSGVVVVGHYAGLTVADMTTLRVRLKAANAGLKVVKNRLAKIALDGTPGAGAADLFTGPTVIAFSEDPVAAPKIAAAYAKEKDKFVLRGGLMGETVLDARAVQQLATLPSLEESRARLLGLLNAPATKLVQVINAPQTKLLRVLQAYAEKSQAAA